VPITLENLAQSVEEMMDRESEWETIAEAGRAWAVEHYAPAATARYVLTTMLDHAPRGE
jgi:hypothetical protein